MSAADRVPTRLWFVPSGARVTHLFSIRAGGTSGRSFCAEWSDSARRLRQMGTTEPTRAQCKTCTRELALAATRLRGSR